MMNDPVQTKLTQEFLNLSSWEDRYKRIIEMGRALPVLPESYKIEDLKVRGCQSQVWLHAKLDENKKIIFQADSDALIVKGLIAILLQVYSGRTADEILRLEPTFISDLGFGSNLSPSRANGLQAMVKQIKYYALAFRTL
jgi:cysteine desulfuration protein SufE